LGRVKNNSKINWISVYGRPGRESKNVVLVRQSVAILIELRCYNVATEDEHDKIEGIREIPVKIEFVTEGVN
jgi:hypothetical protein